MDAAAVDDPVWDASKWQLDRFTLEAKPTAPPGMSAKLRGFFSAQPKALSNICQVDNCTADVSRMKEYHSRYKICEPHLKAMLVVKDGQHQRFCQQCGKFHAVEEFDGDKRSCRDRLTKHNARRRRQREMQHMLRTTGQVDEAALQAKYGLTEDELGPKVQKLARQMSARSSGSDTPSASGTPMHASFAGSALLGAAPAGTASRSPSGGLPAADLDLLNDNFLVDVLGPTTLASLPTSLPAAAAHAAAGGSAVTAFLSVDPSYVMDLDDMAVLEELTREFGLAPNEAALAAAGGAGALYTAGSGGNGGSASPSSRVSAASQFSSGTARQTPMQAAQAAAAFPFALPSHFAFHAPPPTSGPPVITTGIGGLPPYMQAPPPSLPLQGFTSTANTHFVAGPSADGVPMVRGSGNRASFGQPQQFVHQGALLPAESAESQTSVLEDALNLLAYDQACVRFVAEEKLIRFSAKLFGCTPAELHPDLKSSLAEMLNTKSMEGYMRPGCVHLEVNAVLGAAELEALTQRGMRAAAEQFMARTPGTAAAAHTLLLQLGAQMAVVQEGKVVHVLNTAASTRLTPALVAVRPLALPAPAARSASAGVELQLWGYNLAEDDTVLARSKGRHLDVEVLGLTADPALEGGLQRLDVLVSGALTPGSLQVEVMRGAYASAARGLVVAPSREVAEEIRTLEAAADCGDVDTLLYRIGSVLEASAAGPAAAAVAEGGAPAPPAPTARRLLHFAVQRKWPALTRTALEVCTLDCSAAEAAAAVDAAATAATGMPLLQLAVRTQSREMVAILLSFGSRQGHVFRSAAPSHVRGITALHLAALIPDGGEIAGMLATACPDALASWECARAEGGASPLELAALHGTAGNAERLIAEGQFAASAACKHGHCAAEAAKGQEREEVLVKGPAMSRAPSLEVDDVALAKASSKSAARARDAAMGPLLRFASPALEAKYAAFYHNGQVSVDILFMVIAIMSQAAWVVRWTLDRSGLLGWVMVALMSFNAVYLQLAVMWPRRYLRHRDALCVASLLVHKVVQMVITVAPGGGTIYSPTYNATVALLESSSFAQVAMLSFGARARVAFHLPTCALMLLMSITINEPVCSAAFPGTPVDFCVPAMAAFQAVACCALPGACIYLVERRARCRFLRTLD